MAFKKVSQVKLTLCVVDIDIRKPDTGNVNINRPTPQTSHANTESTTTPDHTSSPHVHTMYTEPVSEGEEDENMAVGVAADEIGSLRIPPSEALEAIAFRENEIRQKEAEQEALLAQKRQDASGSQQTEDAEDAGERRALLRRRRPSAPTQTLAIDPLAPSNVFDESLQKKLKETPKPLHEDVDAAGPLNNSQDEETNYVSDFVAQPGKKIAVPVRVEPKVYFAQERTFLVRVHILYCCHC